MLTTEEIKDLLIARYDADQVIELLEPDIEELVEGLHEVISLKQEELTKVLLDI